MEYFDSLVCPERNFVLKTWFKHGLCELVITEARTIDFK